MSLISEMEEAGLYAKDIDNFILYSTVVHEAKVAKAHEAADYWRSIAPVRGDKPTHESKEPTAYGTNWEEDYVNSIEVTEHPDGAVMVGTGFLPLAEWLEYGSEHNPEHGYGLRVLQHFGGTADIADKVTDHLYVG